MIVYHGSNSRFKQLKISKSLVKHESTMLNEGLGIYFTTDRKVAESYGKYIYTLEINDAYYVDFRKKSNCSAYINRITADIIKKLNVDIRNYFNTSDMINRMHYGGQSISRIGHDIAEILENTEEFYFAYSQTKKENIYRALRSYDNFSKQRIKAYMFNYHIKNIGILKVVDDDVVRIKNIEMLN